MPAEVRRPYLPYCCEAYSALSQAGIALHPGQPALALRKIAEALMNAPAGVG